MISGDVHGKIDVKKKIRIYSTGRVAGDLNTPLFAVEEGAFFEGTCHMKGGEAEIHTLPLEQAAAGGKG
jgi:cytoskeletal protein CcmA (bactofilin family)